MHHVWRAGAADGMADPTLDVPEGHLQGTVADQHHPMPLDTSVGFDEDYFYRVMQQLEEDYEAICEGFCQEDNAGEHDEDPDPSPV